LAEEALVAFRPEAEEEDIRPLAWRELARSWLAVVEDHCLVQEAR
jgi:hypothetical protein